MCVEVMIYSLRAGCSLVPRPICLQFNARNWRHIGLGTRLGRVLNIIIEPKEFQGKISIPGKYGFCIQEDMYVPLVKSKYKHASSYRAANLYVEYIHF